MQINTDFSPLVYVWLGSKLPPWAKKSLTITRLANPTRQIVLLSDQLQECKSLKDLGIVQHTYNIAYSQFYLSYHPKDQLSSFWTNTSLRFIYLLEFMRSNKVASLFHAELDNLIFDLSGLAPKLDHYAQALFASQDSITRSIASLIYINKIQALEYLVSLLYDPDVNNDMQALGKMASHSPLFSALPTESFYSSTKCWPSLSPVECGGLFDAASIGQYLYGLPALHTPFTPTYNRFTNENTLLDLSQLRMVSQIPLVLDHPDFPQPISFYNVHIHSKEMNFVFSQSYLDTLTVPFNRGKVTCISRRYISVVGPLLQLFDFCTRLFIRALTSSPLRPAYVRIKHMCKIIRSRR